MNLGPIRSKIFKCFFKKGEKLIKNEYKDQNRNLTKDVIQMTHRCDSDQGHSSTKCSCAHLKGQTNNPW